MFNVVADQLKVSEGWVRCGQCSDVFDASLHLQDTGGFENSRTPSASTQASALIATPNLPEFSVAVQPAPFQDNADQVILSKDLNEEFAQSLQAAVEASAAARDVTAEPPVPQPAPPAEPLAPMAVPVIELARLRLNDEIAAEESAAAADSASFVQDARRQAFWKKSWVRAALTVVAFCLTAALLLQVVVQQKDQLAAWVPQSRPVMQTLCRHLGCQLSPLRKIDAVVIDSSTFNKLGVDSYKLNFSIKNLATVAVAMPSLEVTLTDTQDQALFRRVLLPAQFGAGNALLVPGNDFSGFITVDVSALPAQRNGTAGTAGVAGYRLLAFYP